MIRFSRTTPVELPGFLSALGPIRAEWFLGQLEGHEFIHQTNTGTVGAFGRNLSRQPFIHGERLSLKPTRNFEFGVSVTAMFAGGPTAFTPYSLVKSYSIGNGNAIPGSKSDPGDRRSGMDLSYRIPGLRNWLTFYAEALTEDEFSPIAYLDRSAIYSGVYLPRMPKLPRLDLRVEAGYTDLPYDPYGPGIFYTNSRYPNGYSNRGELMGNWMGRESQAVQAWSTYHLGARNTLSAEFRHQKASKDFVPGGGTLSDASIGLEYWIYHNISLSAAVQHEAWFFPVIKPDRQSNVATSIQLTFWPQHHQGTD